VVEVRQFQPTSSRRRRPVWAARCSAG
jgi:hypothetical protein